MKPSDNIVTVKILDRSYKIKCSAEEAYELQSSAEYLNQQIQKLRQSASAKTNPESVTIVAALNVCHQLMLLKKQQNQTIEQMHDKIAELQQKIQNFLATEEPLPA